MLPEEGVKTTNELTKPTDFFCSASYDGAINLKNLKELHTTFR